MRPRKSNPELTFRPPIAFGNVNEMFLCELEGYAPAGGAVRGKPTLTLVEFDAKLRDFLLNVYHSRENSETKITGGNFRLLNRLLTQMERILEINTLREVSKAVVDAARERLVIGQA